MPEAIQLKGGAVTYDRRLDRIPSADPASLARYPIRSILAEEVVPVAKYWRLGMVTDQGREGACVGHGWTGDAMASPARVHIGPTWADSDYPDVTPSEWAYRVYRDAQKIDEWAGESYDGTSVLAGAKIMQRRGLIGEYRWCRDLNDVRDTIITKGPVVLGISWFDSMYDTTASYRVKVYGEVVGGHCILAYGYNPRVYVSGRYQEIFRLRNSWGPFWGNNGNGWITREDLQKVWDDQGEGCTPLQRYADPQIAA